MPVDLNITDAHIFTLLRAFLLPLAAPAEVIRGPVNRAAMPLGPFVLLTPGAGRPLATPIETHDDVNQTVTISQSTEWVVGVDCFGADANQTARKISMAFRTSYACAAMPGIAPLYSGDAIQFPLVNGEAQYEERWRFDVAFNYQPAIVLPQSSARSLEIDVISVDAIYPPGA